jgi:hypothetical protein
MQIRTSNLDEKLKNMERYAKGAMMEPGVHVGIFAVRTQVHQTGFDVLVRKRARNLLPTAELPIDRLENSHVDFLRRLEGMTLGALHRQLTHAGDLPPRESHFAALLLDGIRSLRASVQDPVFDNATLVSKVTHVPCASPNNDARPATCSLIAFTLMIPIHVRVDAPAFEFIPLAFFKTQQLIYKNSPHNAAFGRAVHRTIAPVLDAACYNAVAAPPPARYRDYVAQFLFPWRDSSPRSNLVQRHQAGSSKHRSERSSPPDAVKLVSASRENMTDMACHESVASLPQYTSHGDSRHGGAGGDARRDSLPGSIRQSLSKSPGEVVTTETKPDLEPPVPPIPSAPKTFGGIMISQEVTVDVEETETAGPASPVVRHGHDSVDGAQGLARHTSLRGQRPGGVVPSYDQAIELKEVTNVLGMGTSKVEVKKEGDEAVTTFVDDLFSTCIDTPRRL